MAIKQLIAAALGFFALGTANTSEELTPDNFEEKVYNNPLPASVEFYAKWCGPCRELRPVFEDVCGELEGKVYCAAYNTDHETDDGSSKFGADSVPIIGFYCHGVQEDRIEGKISKEDLKKRMEDFIGSCN
ncbi:MAG: thioredoxin domain-containing protein [Nanoarchaeota archaeon]|nr:thioredoxin domain-containing protein [Nanoarchaeota archaeon]